MIKKIMKKLGKISGLKKILVAGAVCLAASGCKTGPNSMVSRYNEAVRGVVPECIYITNLQEFSEKLRKDREQRKKEYTLEKLKEEFKHPAFREYTFEEYQSLSPPEANEIKRQYIIGKALKLKAGWEKEEQERRSYASNGESYDSNCPGKSVEQLRGEALGTRVLARSPLCRGTLGGALLELSAELGDIKAGEKERQEYIEAMKSRPDVNIYIAPSN